MFDARAQAGAVLVALMVDRYFGEPASSWHPVAWMGRALSATAAPWAAVSARGAFMRGASCWLLGAAASMGMAYVLSWLIANRLAWSSSTVSMVFQAFLLGLLLKPLLAWRMLYREVAAVSKAVDQNLDAGRQQVARIVSRDTSTLSATAVRESALESLAENLNDSLVAPLFWFALGGLPAAALYRFANTADAMWGYRGRWEWAGKWAARADDVLSYVPARLSAALLALAAWRWPSGWRREARLTPSPNSGWPMAALALLLGIQLSKPGVYVLNAVGRAVEAPDLPLGLRLGQRAVWYAAGLASVVLLGVWLVRSQTV
jgi:adenosylcobinamide-phosphate synthase